MKSDPPTISPSELMERLIDEWLAAGVDLRQLTLEEVKRRFAEALAALDRISAEAVGSP